jgi:3-dehydroquinate synthase
MSDTTRIRVGGMVDDGATPYDVLVGHDLWGEVPALVGERARRVALIHPPTLRAAVDRLQHALRAGGYETFTIETPDGEAAKTAEVAAFCWAQLGRAGFTRTDVVVGAGGGATTDLAGFVAATWLRGVRVVQVPTTLLGMVDAAVGGKTGINTGEGKNLVGAFHPPSAVVCDLDTLRSLPPVDYVAGMAEVVKCGFVADPRILELVEADPFAATRPDGPSSRELVERAISVKAEVVSYDLRETASGMGREILNYGHTFGHAVEKVEGFRWRHGEAVAVGMVYAAELGRAAGRTPDSLVSRHRGVLTSIGLPTSYHGEAWDDLLAAMSLDKKARGRRLRFVVLDGLAQPGRLEGPDPGLLAEAFVRVGATQ